MSEVYIIAGTYREFKNWCRGNQIHPGACIYLDRLEKLGNRAIWPEDCVVKVGTWAERSDLSEILAAVESRRCPQ
jgi:hypothetical protein